MQLHPPPQPEGARSRNRRPWLLVALGLILATTALSFLPPSTKVELHTKGRLHSIGHFVVFGIVAFALLRAARSFGERLLAFAAALSFGLLIEFFEHRVYKNPVEWTDVMVDTMAVLLAATLSVSMNSSR